MNQRIITSVERHQPSRVASPTNLLLCNFHSLPTFHTNNCLQSVQAAKNFVNKSNSAASMKPLQSSSLQRANSSDAQRTHIDKTRVAVLNQHLRKEANYYVKSVSCKLVILNAVTDICYCKCKHTAEYMLLNKALVVNNFISKTTERYYQIYRIHTELATQCIVQSHCNMIFC